MQSHKDVNKMILHYRRARGGEFRHTFVCKYYLIRNVSSFMLLDYACPTLLRGVSFLLIERVCAYHAVTTNWLKKSVFISAARAEAKKWLLP